MVRVFNRVVCLTIKRKDKTWSSVISTSIFLSLTIAQYDVMFFSSPSIHSDHSAGAPPQGHVTIEDSSDTFLDDLRYSTLLCSVPPDRTMKTFFIVWHVAWHGKWELSVAELMLRENVTDVCASYFHGLKIISELPFYWTTITFLVMCRPHSRIY